MCRVYNICTRYVRIQILPYGMIHQEKKLVLTKAHYSFTGRYSGRLRYIYIYYYNIAVS